ncbi:MAG: MBL fold metallo-hydrolase [Polyangiaceae bacterium]
MPAISDDAAQPRRRWRRRLGGLFGLSLVVLVVLLSLSFRAAPLPSPPPFSAGLPKALPPAGMALFQLPTGSIVRNAAVAYRGGSFRDRREFVMTVVLVKHPKGDLLIDTGFGREVEAHFRAMPWLFRAVTSYQKQTAAADQLTAAHFDPSRLRGILLTHVHWDHVSGVQDFPGVAVLLPTEERRFVATGGTLSAVLRDTPDVRYKEYAFEHGPYLGFARSHDFFGDGSVVAVPAPGHTPGSVVIFVTTPDGKRRAFVGDLAWQREGITEREERPWLTRSMADHDPERVKTSLLRMSALAQAFPELVLVPAHDARGFADLPPLAP